MASYPFRPDIIPSTYCFHSLQTSGWFSRVCLDVIGLKLSLDPADATDPFGSSHLSIESALYML